MLVDLQDGRCRTCGSALVIVDADDVSLSVTCSECRDAYDVETDFFGDGCMKYYFPFLLQQTQRADDAYG